MVYEIGLTINSYKRKIVNFCVSNKLGIVKDFHINEILIYEKQCNSLGVVLDSNLKLEAQ